MDIINDITICNLDMKYEIGLLVKQVIWFNILSLRGLEEKQLAAVDWVSLLSASSQPRPLLLSSALCAPNFHSSISIYP